MISFRIKYPETDIGKKDWNKRYSLNAYYAGKHWMERKEDSNYWHWLSHSALATQCRSIKMFEEPVTLEFNFNDSLDCSNHAAIAKMIEDSLRGIVIKDDSRKYVKQIILGFHEEDCIEVKVYPFTKGEIDR